MTETAICPSNRSRTGLLGGATSDLTLRICGTQYDGQVIRIAGTKCSIGAGTGCTLRLRAKGVDPLHCVILRGQSKTIVRQWSPNTRLNGRTFSDEQLRVGDRLAIGPIELEVLEDTPRPAAIESGDTRGDRQNDERLREARRLNRRRVRDLAGELRSARQRVEELQDTVQQQGSEHQQLESRLDELESLLAQADEERGQLRDQLSTADQQLDQTQQYEQLPVDATLAYQTDREQWREERDRLLEDIQQYQQQLDEQASSIADAINPSQTICLSDVQADDHQPQWSDELLEAKQAYERDREQWDQEREELESKVREYENSAQTHEDIAQTTRQQAEDDRRRWEEKVEHLNQQLTALAEPATSEDSARIHQLESDLANVRDEADQLRNKLSEVERANEQRQTRSFSQQTEMRRAEAVLDERATQIDNANSKLHQEREEFAEQQRRFEEQKLKSEEEFSARVEQLDRELEETRAKLATREGELIEKVAALEDRAHELDEAAGRLQSDRDAFDQQREQIESQLSDAAEELVRQGSAIENQRNTSTIQWSPDATAVHDEVTGSLAQQVPITAPSDVEPFAGDDHQPVEQKDEVLFEPTSDESPLSTADVLANMAHVAEEPPQDAEFFPAQMSPPTPTPADDSLRHSPEMPVADAPKPADSEDDSIEEYMARLLQRVRADEATPSTSFTPAPAPQIQQPAQPIERSPEPEETPKSADPSDFVPRRAAPENSLAAMRELANESARAAISVSDKNRNQNTVRGKISMAVISGIIGIGLLLVSPGMPWVILPIAGISLVVTFVFAFQATKVRMPKRPTEAVDSNDERRTDC